MKYLPRTPDDRVPRPSYTERRAFQTAWIGRERELAQLENAVASGRFTAVVGPGGAGKTRLVSELAARLEQPLLELSLHETTHGEELLRIVAEGLQLPAGDGALLERSAELRRWLSESPESAPFLIVVDGFERLQGDGHAVLSDLTATDTGPRWVVTSREPVVGEPSVVALGPLPERDAIALLRHRTEWGRGGAPIGAAEATHLKQLVGTTDRLPLTLEMTASLLAVRSVVELLEEGAVTEGGPCLELLAGLDPDETAALRDAAAFVGSFDLSAARAVIAHPRVEALLDRLARRSLVSVRRLSDGRARFALYDAVRMAVASEAPARRRHTVYYAAEAVRRLAPGALSTLDARRWLALERGNLEAAEAQAEPAEAVARLILALEPGRFQTRAEGEERARLLRARVFADEAGVLDLRVRARVDLARFVRLRGDGAGALEALDEADALLARPDDFGAASDWLSGMVAVERARTLIAYSDRAAVLEHLRRGEAFVGDDPLIRADIAMTRAILSCHVSDWPAAARELARARTLYGRIGDLSGMGCTMTNLGIVQMKQGRLEASLETYRQAVAELRACGNLRSEGIALGNLADLHIRLGRTETARELLARSLRIHRFVGNAGSESLNLSYLARLELIDGRLDDAELHLNEAFAVGEARLTDFAEGHLVETEAQLASARGRASDAAKLLQRAGALQGAGERLVIAKDGGWFKPPCAPAVQLGRRGSARRLLVALAKRRFDGDPPMTVEDVIAAGWPGEKVLPRAGRQRVYVLINTLRGLGLGALETNDDGYFLSRDVWVEWGVPSVRDALGDGERPPELRASRVG